MQSVNIVRSSQITRTARVMQLEGIFEIPPAENSMEQWDVNLQLPEQWNVGLIVGPSGSGKTTVANELFGDYVVKPWEWSRNHSILDSFPDDMSIKEIVALLSSVGFSSPPSWLRPFHVLSNGEQFRVNMARTLAENKEIAVVDEFSSVVDRTVAQIGSYAIQKTVRKRNQKFIAVSCHYDIAEWLEPDWVYQPHTNELIAGRSLRRPKINLEVKRVHSDAWALFRKHHYLNTSINTSAICFCAFINGEPVAFSSLLHYVHPNKPRTKREHRTVCLPDYQGAGIGNALSAYVGSLCKGMGFDFISVTSNPAMVQWRNNSPLWKMKHKPGFSKGGNSRMNLPELAKYHATRRFVAGFEYVGPGLSRDEAESIWLAIK